MASEPIRPDNDDSDSTRKLPANLEAEAAFLGAVLLDNRILEELQVPILPAHFFEPLHERIFDRIKALIDAEPPDKVLSDDGLVEILKADGIDIARRTVAKYRESMRIPSSVQRRRDKKIQANSKS